MLRKRGVVLLLAIVVGAFALAVGVLYQSIVLGGSVARGKEPPGLEVTVAQWLLHRSVPPQTRLLKN